MSLRVVVGIAAAIFGFSLGSKLWAAFADIAKAIGSLL